MNFKNLFLLIILLLKCNSSYAGNTPLGDVPMNITITSLPKISIEKPQGGWYDKITLNNNAGSNTNIFSNTVPLLITVKGQRDFLVSLVAPLTLVNSEDNELFFSEIAVKLGTQLSSIQNLTTTPTSFTNPPLESGLSTGNYLLNISARQPQGNRGKISGNYTGTLTLLFEIQP